MIGPAAIGHKRLFAGVSLPRRLAQRRLSPQRTERVHRNGVRAGTDQLVRTRATDDFQGAGGVPCKHIQQGLNRTGFIGGLIPREDGAHGTTQ